MFRFIKKNYKYIILFMTYLIWFLIIQPLDLDEIWNYGFSISMADGYLPYKDFNMVITPFFNYLISIPLHLFGKSILIYHIEGAVIFITTVYLLFKIIDNKTWVIIAVLFCGIAEFYPNYNFFCYFLLVLIIFLEKKQKNKYNYLIGVLVGIIILSKQTIGCFMAIPCIFISIYNKKNMIKRLIGISIPIMIFVLYLILTNTFSYFVDLCIVGLFDFAKRVTYPKLLLLFILILIISIYICIKNKTNKTNYYILMFYIVSIPIFDLNHIEFMIIAFLILLFDNIKVNNIEVCMKYCSIFLIIVVNILSFLSVTSFNIKYYPNKFKHFEYKYIKKSYIDKINSINKIIKKYGKENIIILGSSESYFLKIQNDVKIEYSDLINKGNWGYNPKKKQLNYIKKNKNKIYFLDTSYLHRESQVEKEVIKYIIKNGKKIDSIEIYDVYILREQFYEKDF